MWLYYQRCRRCGTGREYHSAEVSDEEDTFYNYEVTYAINCAVRYLMKQDGFEFKSHFEDDADYDTYNAYYDEAYKQAKHKLYTGGYKVTTTMNLKAQKTLQKILINSWLSTRTWIRIPVSISSRRNDCH